MSKFTTYMDLALTEARAAAARGETPVGAVLVDPANGKVLAKNGNRTRELSDPTAHAEMIAITQAASAIGDWRLTDTVLYVTKEPCPMCAGAIALARIPKVVFGARDPQSAGTLNAGEIVRGVLEKECRFMLQDFFQTARRQVEQRTDDGHRTTAR